MSKPTVKFEDITLDDVLGDGIEAISTDEGAKGASAADDSDDNDNIKSDPLDDDEDEKKSSKLSKKLDTDDSDDDDTADSDDDDDSCNFGDGDDGIISSIAKSLGYELEKEYAETEEGLAEFTKDIAQNIAEDQLDGLFKQFPLVQKHLDFVLAGGDPEKFFNCGKRGTGYAVKLVLNMLWFNSFVATTEALLLGVKAGVDLETLRQS